MVALTLIIFLIIFILTIAWGLISLTLFYHIGRYSYIGDASKRIFVVYLGLGSFVIILSIISLIINHLVS